MDLLMRKEFEKWASRFSWFVNKPLDCEENGEYLSDRGYDDHDSQLLYEGAKWGYNYPNKDIGTRTYTLPDASNPESPEYNEMVNFIQRTQQFDTVELPHNSSLGDTVTVYAGENGTIITKGKTQIIHNPTQDSDIFEDAKRESAEYAAHCQEVNANLLERLKSSKTSDHSGDINDMIDDTTTAEDPGNKQ